MKIDISRLTFASQDYPYQISSGIPLASVYSQEQQYFAAGGNLGSFNGPTYTGHPTDQRDLVTLGYTNPVTSTSGYYGYSEAVTNYNQHPSQWNNIQTSFHDTTSDQMTQWNSGFDDGYATYQESIPRVSLRTSLLATQLPVTTQSQTPFPVLDTLNSASSGRVLPKLTELPLTSESEMPFPTEAEDRVSWASSCGSRQNSDASHNISQELPTVQSSFNQSGPALIRQDRLNQGRALHMYPTLSHKIPESAHTMATVPSLMAPSPYGNQQLSDRYHYNFSPARPAELSNSTLRSNSTIGNHTLNLLPYRGRCAELGTLQYEIHNGVPKAASRIAVESGGNGRTSQRR